jgi:hypothetical protein
LGFFLNFFKFFFGLSLDVVQTDPLRRRRSLDHVPDEEDYEVHLERTATRGLGFSISGGKESVPYDENGDDGIYISRIIQGDAYQLTNA